MRDVTVTNDDLQRAWEALHKPDWLPLQQAMHAAAQYKLVYGLALRMANGERPSAAAQEPRHVPKPAPWPPAPSSPPLPRHEAIFDNKRASSGERPSDYAPSPPRTERSP